MHCFLTTLRLLLHIDVIHQASASCPGSWAQAEWIFNHIRDTFPANVLQWVGMGLKQFRLLSTKTGSGTCSINHQWSPDIVSILIRCNCPACRTTLIATRFRVAVICPIIQVPHCITVFFYFVWFVFINHIFQFYYELCTYCNILDIYLS